MKEITPHELVGNQRDVWWNDLDVGIPMTLELVDYFNAPVRNKGRRGHYVIYYAISKTDYPSLGILKEDDFLFFFSFGNLCNAIKKLPNSLTLPCTKEFADGKNCLIKFERVNEIAIKIIHQEVIDPTEEQLIEAKKQYEILRMEDKQRIEREKRERLR